MFGLNDTPSRGVPAEGPTDAKIAIVGEAPGGHEQRQGRPFIGPAGQILDNCLHNAGLVRSDIYITNLVKTQPYKNNISPWFNKGRFTEKGQAAVEVLKDELSSVGANVIVPMGNPALAALTGLTSVTKYRGYAFNSTLLPGRKILPTIHPAASLHGQYIFRYYIVSDLKKAKVESEYPDIRYTERRLIYDSSMAFTEVMEWLDFIAAAPEFAFDIEVVEFQVSCISFATSHDLSVSIPLYQRWTEEEEAQIWIKIASILENPNTTKIVQNGLAFDVPFLATNCGIITRGQIKDTMIAHSIIYPDMKKGLDFLGSIYTFTEYWKDAVKWDDPKKES